MGANRNQLEQVRRLLLTRITALLDEGAPAQRAYQDAFATLTSSQKPACFTAAGSVLKSMENGFERLLVVLSECGCPNPDALTTYRFYHWLDYLEEKFEAQKPLINPPHAPKRQ